MRGCGTKSTDMTFPNPTYIRHDGFDIALYEAGPEDGLPLILVHGWPEMAYSWKNQMGVLAAAGYRVIAYDVRGFGRSSAPDGMTHYGVANLVSDIEAILSARDIEQAVLTGHDWGGIIVWRAARMLAERILGVIGICTPHYPPAPVDPLKVFRKRHGDDHYFIDFNDHPGRSDALFLQNTENFFRFMFAKIPPGTKMTSELLQTPKRFAAYLAAGAPDADLVMSDADLKVYARHYSRSGFHGGLNLYRNTTANWEQEAGMSSRITQPVLMISAREDLFLPPEAADGMEKIIPDLERHVIEDCGHWAMWEQPEVLNELMLEWLGRRMSR